jgi:hypothetical protein
LIYINQQGLSVGGLLSPHVRYLAVAGLPRASIGMIEVYFSIFQRKLTSFGPADLKRGFWDTALNPARQAPDAGHGPNGRKGSTAAVANPHERTSAC